MSTYHLFFNNLANELRVDIISALKHKDLCVGELSRELKVEQSKLSHALTNLKSCNLVKVRKKGKQRVYSLNKKTMLPILEIIDEHSREHCGGKCGKCNICN
jgi:DNA-binding transcriptional ArsR family regulator